MRKAPSTAWASLAAPVGNGSKPMATASPRAVSPRAPSTGNQNDRPKMPSPPKFVTVATISVKLSGRHNQMQMHQFKGVDTGSDKPELRGVDDGLEAGVDPQLAQDPVYIVADGGWGDGEGFGHLPGGEAAGEKPQDFGFPGREAWRRAGRALKFTGRCAVLALLPEQGCGLAGKLLKAAALGDVPAEVNNQVCPPGPLQDNNAYVEPLFGPVDRRADDVIVRSRAPRRAFTMTGQLRRQNRWLRVLRPATTS